MLEPVGGVPVALKVEGQAAEVRIDAPATLKLGGAKTQIGAAVRGVESVVSGSSARLILVLEDGFEARGFREDDGFVVDIARPKLAIPPPEAGFEPAAQPLAEGPAEAPAAPPRAEPEATSRNADASPPRRPDIAGMVSASTKVTSDEVAIEFPFHVRTAAAAFERGGVATVVFQTQEPLEFDPLPPAAAPFAAFSGVTRQGAFTVLRFALTGPALTRLAQKGDAWVLSIGGTGLTPSEPVAMRRNTDDLGRTLLHLGLGDAAGVFWLEDAAGGERIAVATAYGPARGIVKPQRFVEFGLLPSAHGVAAVAGAEDLAVRSGWDGVTISREMGLAITMDDAVSGMPDADPVLERERWNRDRLGSILARQRELSAAVIEAPRSGRSAARIELARFLMANRLDPEAVGVLSAAALDDPTLARQRQFLLLQAIALARANRAAEARRVLRPTSSRKIRRRCSGVRCSTPGRSDGRRRSQPSGARRRRSTPIPTISRSLCALRWRGPQSRRRISISRARRRSLPAGSDRSRSKGTRLRSSRAASPRRRGGATSPSISTAGSPRRRSARSQPRPPCAG